MGLDIRYLYSLTPRQFSNIQAGWSLNIEIQTKTSWEQTRRLVFSSLQPYLKSKKSVASDIMPFPWDVLDQDESTNLPNEGYAEMSDRWSKIDEMKKQSISVWQV